MVGGEPVLVGVVVVFVTLTSIGVQDSPITILIVLAEPLVILMPPVMRIMGVVDMVYFGMGMVEGSVCDGRLFRNVVFGQLAPSTFRGQCCRGVYG